MLVYNIGSLSLCTKRITAYKLLNLFSDAEQRQQMQYVRALYQKQDQSYNDPVSCISLTLNASVNDPNRTLQDALQTQEYSQFNQQEHLTTKTYNLVDMK